MLGALSVKVSVGKPFVSVAEGDASVNPAVAKGDTNVSVGYKTRNVAVTAPYMHDGSLATLGLADVAQDLASD